MKVLQIVLTKAIDNAITLYTMGLDEKGKGVTLTSEVFYRDEDLDIGIAQALEILEAP